MHYLRAIVRYTACQLSGAVAGSPRSAAPFCALPSRHPACCCSLALQRSESVLCTYLLHERSKVFSVMHWSIEGACTVHVGARTCSRLGARCDCGGSVPAPKLHPISTASAAPASAAAAARGASRVGAASATSLGMSGPSLPRLPPSFPPCCRRISGGQPRATGDARS